MSEPIYRQIAEDLRSRIESGLIPPGRTLPTEPELQDSYRASRNTIRDALRWLRIRGLVETRAGHGTFVTQKITPYVTTLSGDWQAERRLDSHLATARDRQAGNGEGRSLTPKVEIRGAAGYVATLLCIAQGTSLITRCQKRYIDGRPWSLETSYYPMTLVGRGAPRLLEVADIREGTVKYLQEALHIKQVGYQDRIVVRTPGQNEASFLELPDDGRAPVAAVLRSGFTAGPNGPAPFCLTERVFAADRNQFLINAGEVSSQLAASVPV